MTIFTSSQFLSVKRKAKRQGKHIKPEHIHYIVISTFQAKFKHAFHFA